MLIAAGVGTWWWLRDRWQADYPDPESLLQSPFVDAVAMRTTSGNLELRWVPEAPRTNIYGGKSTTTFTKKPVEVVYGETVALLEQSPAKDYPYHLLEFEGQAHDGERLVVAVKEVPLEGAINFRDIGGYRTANGQHVRWNRIYRAGQLGHLTDEDMNQLEALGIQISCDLRSQEERDEQPDVLPDSVRYLHYPIQTNETRAQQIRRLVLNRGRMDSFMQEAYIQVIVDANADVYAQIFELVADEDNLPLILHCTAGKDRTGVGVALLLSYLGVPDDVILADYSLSNKYFEDFVNVGEDAIRSVSRLGLSVETLLPLFTADPSILEGTLTHIRKRYGSVHDYLINAGGISEETLKRVRQNMVR